MIQFNIDRFRVSYIQASCYVKVFNYTLVIGFINMYRREGSTIKEGEGLTIFSFRK